VSAGTISTVETGELPPTELRLGAAASSSAPGCLRAVELVVAPPSHKLPLSEGAPDERARESERQGARVPGWHVGRLLSLGPPTLPSVTHKRPSSELLWARVSYEAG
jgi:hypothetical protein